MVLIQFTGAMTLSGGPRRGLDPLIPRKMPFIVRNKDLNGIKVPISVRKESEPLPGPTVAPGLPQTVIVPYRNFHPKVFDS